jgi:hypothetical protein
MILEDDFETDGTLQWSIFEELIDYQWDLCLMSHNPLCLNTSYPYDSFRNSNGSECST